jgi:hypothetical protein
VANLLNKPTDGATVSVRKDYFPSGCEYVKLPFSLRVPKNLIMYYETSKNKVFEVFCFWISGYFKRKDEIASHLWESSLGPDFGRSSAAQTRKNPPRRNKKKISSSVYREQP